MGARHLARVGFVDVIVGGAIIGVNGADGLGIGVGDGHLGMIDDLGTEGHGGCACLCRECEGVWSVVCEGGNLVRHGGFEYRGAWHEEGCLSCGVDKFGFGYCGGWMWVCGLSYMLVMA